MPASSQGDAAIDYDGVLDAIMERLDDSSSARATDNDHDSDGQEEEDFVAFDEDTHANDDDGDGDEDEDEDEEEDDDDALQFVGWKPEIELPTLPKSEEIFREKAKTVGPSPSADLHLLHGASHIAGVDDESRLRIQKRAKRKAGEDVGDEEWYRLPSQKLTPELKQELRLLKLRNVMDPKRHYRGSDSSKLPTRFQIGTVIAGADEFYSSRLTKRERKSSLVGEALADKTLKTYRARKWKAMQREKIKIGRKMHKLKRKKK